MKLSALAKEPKLVKIEIDDSIIVETYGEIIEFWIYDRVDMETFMALASLEGEKNISEVINLMKNLILDDQGKPVMSDKKFLPNDIMIKAVEKTVQALGNFATLTSKK